VVLIVLTQLFLNAWTASSTSLGAVARREVYRRAALPPSVHVLTDADLGPPPPTPVVVAAGDPVVEPGTPPVTPPVAPPPAASVAVAPVHDEAWWQGRMNDARAAVERDRVLVAALESRVAALTTDVANRDDPAQRAVLAADRLRAIAELDRLREQVKTGLATIDTIQEDARKAGIRIR
jgi:hypothetical protein